MNSIMLGIASLALLFFQAAQATPLVENEFVLVSRDRAPCAAGAPACGNRVVVALGTIALGGEKLHRGEIRVFKAGERYTPPADGDYLEVVIKPGHPKVSAPTAGTPPAPDNRVLYDGRDFTVFAERMRPGELSAVHSHNLRLAIFLNKTQVQQWNAPAMPPNGKSETRELVPDTVMWRPAVVHASKDVGTVPISNLLIEFKP
jgi:hypothetical protein